MLNESWRKHAPARWSRTLRAPKPLILEIGCLCRLVVEQIDDDVAANLPRYMAVSRSDRDEWRRLYIKLHHYPSFRWLDKYNSAW